MATVPHARPDLDTSDVPTREGDVAALGAALASRPPYIPSKYLYDDLGSRLFEHITELPEYYQTRTEWSILESSAAAIVAEARPAELIELGAGNGRKIGALLEAIRADGRPGRCTLLDINQTYVESAARRLRLRFPGAEVRGVQGDFLSDLSSLAGRSGGAGRMFVFFAGTFGNLLPEQRARFLQQVAAALEPGGTLLVGVDLVKDPTVLEAAYNDSAGVTAAFNLNILRVVNRAAGADFDPAAFEHRAFFDREREWIEMRVRAVRPCRVRVSACDLDLRLAPGDEIRTEVSAKFSRASFEAALEGTGLGLAGWFTDADDRFALALARRGDA